MSGAEKEVALLELPEPSSPGPGQILVAVEAAGVGPWDELLNGAGWDVGLRPPAALGVEGAGKVLAVGAGVRVCRRRPGARTRGPAARGKRLLGGVWPDVGGSEVGHPACWLPQSLISENAHRGAQRSCGRRR
ncbi:alcohol dehydrogenase catalytic domain-containing protein [Streptomyces sioyaensis]|uniref:alcohol dehydrogenase catalytic domain-containing protein n=1 Tax=Streptomyces sioyaensis TaxID=67364 RepID=UPI00378FEF5C